MLTETQLRILSLVLRLPDLHCAAIARQVKLTPMAITKAVRRLVKEGCVTVVPVGKSHIIRLKPNPDHLEYYSLAEKLTSRRQSPILAKANFAIITNSERLAIAEQPIKGIPTITLTDFLNNYKKYQHLLTGERVIINPYNFWKVMVT
ncbi:MarR family transcriptional regulator [Candidatus Woesearchaeota archaeon]|nr:MarR family transcriptional regulator [Candidatus Woesearchaeota archaeon]